MTSKKSKCPVTDCPAQRRPHDCGYLVAGTPCRNPRHRDEWERKTADKEEKQCSELN